MAIENLETELRRQDRFSEDDIRQILSFIFSLNEYLPPVVNKIPVYFCKYLVFRASNFYKSISAKEAKYVNLFEENITKILENLLTESSNEGLTKDYLLKRAKEEIIKAVCSIQQRIIDVSTLALKETFSKIKLNDEQIGKINILFDERLKFQLKQI